MSRIYGRTNLKIIIKYKESLWALFFYPCIDIMKNHSREESNPAYFLMSVLF